MVQKYRTGQKKSWCKSTNLKVICSCINDTSATAVISFSSFQCVLSVVLVHLVALNSLLCVSSQRHVTMMLFSSKSWLYFISWFRWRGKTHLLEAKHHSSSDLLSISRSEMKQNNPFVCFFVGSQMLCKRLFDFRTFHFQSTSSCVFACTKKLNSVYYLSNGIRRWSSCSWKSDNYQLYTKFCQDLGVCGYLGSRVVFGVLEV